MANNPTPLPNPSQKHPEMPTDVQKQVQEQMLFKLLTKELIGKGQSPQDASKKAMEIIAKNFKPDANINTDPQTAIKNIMTTLANHTSGAR